MTKEIPKYIIQKDISGEEYTIDNPEYIKHVRKIKYDFYLKKSGMPEFYYNIGFKDYKGNENSEEFKKIKYYAEHCHEEKFKNASLYLYGTQGTQKTALLCNIGKEAIKNGLKVKFILAGHLIDKLMKLQGFNVNEEVEEEIKELKQQDLLLIDDIFDTEKTLYWKQSSNIIITEWDCFLRDVLSNNVKIVVTSNYGLETIKQHFGLSIYELIDRNFHTLQLTDNIKHIRKLTVKSVFDDME